MTTATIAENLQQYKSRFSLIVEQKLIFAWSANLVREGNICLQISNKLYYDILRYR